MEGSMRVLGSILFFLSMPLLATTELTTQIYDIDYGHKKNDEVLILLTSGHVAKLNKSHDKIVSGFKNNKTKDNWFNIKLDHQRYITEIEPTEAPEGMDNLSLNKSFYFQEYVPTTIANMEIAKKYHKEARLYAKDSQCFNRAMVWSYEWWKKHSLKSNKILIYFTRNYIRRFGFEWWFHIAPLVNIMHEGKVVERVMDIKYTRGPLEIKKWTDIFMRNDAPCQVITKFSDYADYPYSGDCFLQRTNMYTLQPSDLQMNESWGYTKENFIMDEVRASYLEAFNERI